MKQKYDFISIIKILAILLITTSHLDHYYPENLKILGTGGMLGNVLFFFSTGFLLFNQIKDGFLLWFYKKINRI
jgi:peptidoglycan/LPS O-acetylase OafA/YrhL